MVHDTYRQTAEEAVAVAHRVVWATVTTVDRVGRPRGRVLHPIWVDTDHGLEGWITTRRTPVKVRHLAANPHLSCSYLAPNHDVAFFDCVAAWADSSHARRRAWSAFASAPPPVGYDPATVFPDGPDGPDFDVLHLRPYRLQIGHGEALARGERPRLWQAPRVPVPA